LTALNKQEFKKRAAEIHCAFGNCKPEVGKDYPIGIFTAENKKGEIIRIPSISAADFVCDDYNADELRSLIEGSNIPIGQDATHAEMCRVIKQFLKTSSKKK
jgi:hypothetical protein